MKFLKTFLLFICLFFADRVYSNHILGGNISYECLGGDEYLITINIYADCLGGTDPVDESIIYFSPDASCTGLSLQGSLATLVSNVEISDLCETELPLSSCNPNEFVPGTQLWTYQMTQTLDPSCVWTVIWAEFDYNFFINADFPIFQDAYVSTTIDPTLGCNSTIEIDGTMQIPYGNVGVPVSHQIEYVSASGNDVNFTMVTPQVELSLNALDLPGYDPTGITVSPTGLVEFTPPTAGNYVLSVLIEEVDAMGNVLYSMLETMTIVSILTVPGDPEFTAEGAIDNDGGTPISNIEFEVCSGDSLCLTFETVHPDPLRTMIIGSNITDFDATATVEEIPCPVIDPDINNVCAEVCMLIDDQTDFIFEVFVEDNNCTDPGLDTVDISIIIGEGSSLSLSSADSTICAGIPVDFELETSGQGDLTFQYSQEFGGLDPDTLTISPFNNDIILSPNETTEYCLVNLTDSEGCIASIDDTNSCFTITVNPELTTTGFGNDTALCTGESIDVDLGLTGTDPFSIYYTQITTESMFVQSSSLDLNSGELWTLSPDSSMTLVIDSIVDGSIINPCVLIAPDEININVNPFTILSFENDSLSCLNENVNLSFHLESFTGNSFNITYSADDGGGPVNFEITGIPIADFGTDSTYVYTHPNPITSDITFSLISVTDNLNTCTDVINDGSSQVTLLGPTVEATISGTENVCFGQTANAVIEVTGDGPWTLMIDTPDSAMDEEVTINSSPFNYSMDAAGDYTITSVQDVHECAATSIMGAASYNELALPYGVLSGSSVLCSGQSTEVDVNISVGDPTFDIVISDPNGDPITFTAGVLLGDSAFTATLPGNYSITSITDNQCVNDTITSVFTLNEVSSPEATISSSGFLCDSDSTLLEISINGGTGPFTYDIEETVNASTYPMNAMTNEDSLYVSVAGNYSITNFSDSNNCPNLSSNNTTITDQALPLADAGPDFSACANATEIIGTSDLNGYTYSWTSNDNNVLTSSILDQTQVTLINTGAADVLFEAYLDVFDQMCHGLDTVLVTVTPQPLSDAGADIFVCYGEPAQLDGMGNGILSWEDNGNLDDFLIGNPNVLGTMETDTFILVIEDAMNPGCIGLDSVIVNVNPQLEVSLDFTDELCFGECNGQITAIYQGGTNPTDITWLDPNAAVLNNADLTDLCAGNYTLNVTDANNCVLDSIITINALPEYYIDDVMITNPVCFGEVNGVIDVFADDVITYDLNSDTQATSLFTDLAIGDFNITVTNSIGCLADTTVSLTSNPELFISTNFESTTICLGDEITFEATANGGIGDYNYFWIPSTNPFNTNSNTVTFEPQENTSVEVYATDNAGQCFSDTLTMEALFSSEILVDVSEDITICQGEEVDLTALASGGIGVLSCFWNVPEEGIINDCSTSVSPDVTTVYSISVEDGCTAPGTAEVTVTVNETPTSTFSFDAMDGCYPVTVNFINETDPGLQGNCVWNFGDGSDPIPVCGDISYTYANPGTFLPSLTVSSDEGCSSTMSASTSISVNDYPSIDFTWEPNPVTVLEPQVQFINLTNGGTNYEWDVEGEFTSNSPNPFYEFEPNTLETHNICLAAENQFGCADTLCKFLVIEGIVLVHVPSAFTPDGDGRNEVFLPVTVGISSNNYLFQIWSRHGELIFETNEPGTPWDGSVNNGTHYVKSDVYTWVLEVEDAMTADVEVFKGSVSIIR